MLKRLTSFILCLTIIFQFTYISEAKTSSTDIKIMQKEQAVDYVKKLLVLGKDYTLDNAQFTTQEKHMKNIWAIEFTDANNDKSIRVEVDAVSKELISYDLWERSDKSVVTYTKEEANETAIDFIKQVCPDKLENLVQVDKGEHPYIYDKLNMNYENSSTYKFLFLRKFDDELFMQNYVIVEVSAINNKVEAFNMVWNNASYDKSNKYLNDNIAENQFKKANAIKLKYVVESKDDNGKLNIKPVYYYEQQGTGILDIEKSKFLDRDDIYNCEEYSICYDDKTESCNMQAKSNYVTIPQEGVISKEEANDIGLSIARKLNINNLMLRDSYYFGNDENKIWRLYFSSKTGSSSLNIELDAENKKIYSLYYTNPEQYKSNDEIEKSEEIKDADKIILDIKDKVNDIFSDIKEEELEFDIQKDEQGDITVNSVRYFNKIPFNDHYINVELNSETHKIKDLSFNWYYDVNVQEVSNIMAIDKIQDIFYSKVGFEKYVIQLKDKNKSDAQHEIPLQKLRLVYVLKPFDFSYLDCRTGKLLDSSLEPFKEIMYRSESFGDIAESSYEKAINFMNKMGFLREFSNEFKPKKLLTKRDAIKWLVCVLNQHSEYYPRICSNNINNEKIKFEDVNEDDPYYYYFKRAVDLGIIDNVKYINPTVAVTKIDCIRYILNGLGYKSLAAEPIFKIKNQDKFNEDIVGYLAIASHYSIFDNQKLETTISRGLYVQTLYDLIVKLEQGL